MNQGYLLDCPINFGITEVASTRLNKKPGTAQREVNLTALSDRHGSRPSLSFHATQVTRHSTFRSRPSDTTYSTGGGLDKPLKSSLKIRGKWIRLEYESLPQVCFRCGIIGHDQIQCVAGLGSVVSKVVEEGNGNVRVNCTTMGSDTTGSLDVGMNQSVNSASESVRLNDSIRTNKDKAVESSDDGNSSLGPWNLVTTRRARKNTKIPGSNDAGMRTSGSRFGLLANENVDDVEE